MELLKRHGKDDPFFLLSRGIIVMALIAFFAGLLVSGVELAHPSVDEKGKKYAALFLGITIFCLILYLATMARYRQREADTRFRGLAAYVEELRAYTVPRIDSIEDYLQKNGQEEEAAPPPVVVPTEPATEKLLGTRERDTLLTIIAAIVKEGMKLKLDQPGKTAQYIEGLTDQLGAHVSKRAIEDHLKKIPNALETRMK